MSQSETRNTQPEIWALCMHWLIAYLSRRASIDAFFQAQSGESFGRIRPRLLCASSGNCSNSKMPATAAMATSRLPNCQLPIANCQLLGTQSSIDSTHGSSGATGSRQRAGRNGCWGLQWQRKSNHNSVIEIFHSKKAHKNVKLCGCVCVRVCLLCQSAESRLAKYSTQIF